VLHNGQGLSLKADLTLKPSNLRKRETALPPRDKDHIKKDVIGLKARKAP